MREFVDLGKLLLPGQQVTSVVQVALLSLLVRSFGI